MSPVRDVTGCEFDATAGGSRVVWLNIETTDGETDQHAMSADAAEALGRELIDAANDARSPRRVVEDLT